MSSFQIKDVIHTEIASSVFNEIFSQKADYYYFIGRVLPWEVPSSPEAVEDTQSYEYQTRNSIIAIKKIQPFDVSFVARRIDWTSGTIYDQFDGEYTSTNTATSGATKLKDANFYALTDQFNVYKCLFNNNGAASTEKPTGNDPNQFTTSDGYVWKYLYTLPLSLRNRFLTNTLMPVQKSVLNPYYSNGEIDSVVIDSRGSGYQGNAEVELTVYGNFAAGSGNTSALLIPVFNQNGSIVDVVIRNAGNNYLNANIVITETVATGSSYYKNLSNVSILNTGAGYDTNAIANTTVTISTSGLFQPTSNAVASPTFSNEALTSFVITNTGNGYSENVISNTTITIATSGNVQPITNAIASLGFAQTAILTPVVFNRQIDRVIISDPGVGYRSNIQTTLSLIGDGIGANLVAFINEIGELEDVIIQDRGEGYTFLDIEVVGDGTGANVIPSISTGDLDTLQSTVELAAIPGAIYNIRIDSAGNNYSNANVTITGDGTGFAGTVVISNANTVSSITVTNPGSGYTYANVVITGNGSNATASAILSPEGGHGSNAIKELFADTILLYSTINNERIHSVDVNNDYRQFGIIKNIKRYGNQRQFANLIGTPCFLVTANTVIDSTSNTLRSDTILQLQSDTSREFEVIEVVSSNNTILLNGLNNYTLEEDDVLYEPNTASEFTITLINNLPTINKFSGDLIFIDNRTKVSYSDQQLVTLKTLLRL